MGYGDHVKVALGTMLQTLGVDGSINGTTIRGVWAKDYYQAEMGEVRVNSSQPMFVTKSSEFQAAGAVGDSITIEGTTYQVREAQPDTWDTTVLILSE